MLQYISGICSEVLSAKLPVSLAIVADCLVTTVGIAHHTMPLHKAGVASFGQGAAVGANLISAQ